MYLDQACYLCDWSNNKVNHVQCNTIQNTFKQLDKLPSPTAHSCTAICFFVFNIQTLEIDSNILSWSSFTGLENKRQQKEVHIISSLLHQFTDIPHLYKRSSDKLLSQATNIAIVIQVISTLRCGLVWLMDLLHCTTDSHTRLYSFIEA